MKATGDRNPFYVGYAPSAAPGVARWLRPRLTAVLAVLLACGAALALTQRPFSAANFEFGVVRSFEGVIDLEPVPSLVVERPGGIGLAAQANPAGLRGPAPASRYLLAAFGKHGAGPALAGLDGHRVRLSGSLVHRDDQTLIELSAGALEDLGAVKNGQTSALASGSAEVSAVTLQGEIVDSKCFLGVMKPGNLKPHRACATRCISGGIPPVFLVRDSAGLATYYLLTDADGGAVNDRILDRVAEPLEITGSVQRLDDFLVLRSDPASYRRLESNH